MLKCVLKSKDSDPIGQVAREFNISRQTLFDGLSSGIDFWLQCKEITHIAQAKANNENVTRLNGLFEQAHSFLKNKICGLNEKDLDDKFVDELNY